MKQPTVIISSLVLPFPVSCLTQLIVAASRSKEFFSFFFEILIKGLSKGPNSVVDVVSEGAHLKVLLVTANKDVKYSHSTSQCNEFHFLTVGTVLRSHRTVTWVDQKPCKQLYLTATTESKGWVGRSLERTAGFMSAVQPESSDAATAASAAAGLPTQIAAMGHHN